MKGLTWEEKYEWVHQRMLKGKRLFKKQSYGEAIQVYFKALPGIDYGPKDIVRQFPVSPILICDLSIA